MPPAPLSSSAGGEVVSYSPSTGRGLALPLVAAIGAVLVVVVGMFWWFGRGPADRASAGTAPTTASPAPNVGPGSTTPDTTTATSPSETETETITPTPTPTPTPTVDEEQASLAELNTLVEQGRSSVRPHGQVVVQLSSKQVGTKDPRLVAANGTHTFYAADILAEYRDFKDRFEGSADVVLLMSTDYAPRYTAHGKPFWVTFAIRQFTGIRQAEQWCAQQFPTLSGKELKNVCFPRTLDPAGP